MTSAGDGALDSSLGLPKAKDLRVLAVIPGDGKGNSFIFARRQVESLISLGVDVQIFYLKSRMSPAGIWKEWRRLRKHIRNFSADLVHAHYGTMTSFVCACSCRRPIIITFRGSDLNGDPSVGFIRMRLGLLLSQLSTLRASRIVCTSNCLRERLWWRRSKALVLPSGVDLRLFKPKVKEECRRILGWELQERVVLFNAGKVPLLKGLSMAREVVAIVRKKLGPVRLFELDGCVPPERIPIYMNAADCLVLASKAEGSPNILKEAMACNLPVASVDAGDAAERLEGVYPSRVVSPNAANLACAVSEILETPSRSNGREKIQDYSHERVAEILKEIYQEVSNRQQSKISISH